MSKFNYLSAILLSTALTACDKDKDKDPEPEKPSTYSFDNVSYSGQTDRLDMLGELTEEMKKATTEVLDEAKMLNMFTNENSPFENADLNSSSKQLKNKCFDAVGAAYSTSTFEYLIQRQAGLSSTAAGASWMPGQAGTATSASGTKSYFLDEGGVEYAQIIDKGLMGAVFYYQIAETYTRNGKIGPTVDNETIVPGEGTDMEHHWDEAFGYFGAPIDFSADNYEQKIDNGDARFYGKYAGKGQDAGINTVTNAMQAYIDGRFAISNKNEADKLRAAKEVREAIEMVIASTVIHYINSTISNFSDDALRYHALSEAYAFMISLHYNSDKKISDNDLLNLRSKLEVTHVGGAVPSFTQASIVDLNDIKNEISSIYGLNNVKDVL